MQPLLPPSLASALIAAQNGQQQLAILAEMRKMDAQDSRLSLGLIDAGQANVQRAALTSGPNISLDTLLALIDAGQANVQQAALTAGPNTHLDTLALIAAGQANVQGAALTAGPGANVNILV